MKRGKRNRVKWELLEAQSSINDKILPMPYISFEYIRKNVCEDEPKADKSRFVAIIKESKVYQIRYSLVLLTMGKEVQKCLDRLERKKELNVMNLKSFIKFSSQHLSKASSFNFDVRNLHHDEILKDSRFMLWNELLRDILIDLSELTKNVTLMFTNELLPLSSGERDTEDK